MFKFMQDSVADSSLLKIHSNDKLWLLKQKHLGIKWLLLGPDPSPEKDQGLNPGGEDGLRGHQHQKRLIQATQELQGHLWILSGGRSSRISKTGGAATSKETNPSDPNGGTTAETMKPSFRLCEDHVCSLIINLSSVREESNLLDIVN